jgi:hypothetical protein
VLDNLFLSGVNQVVIELDVPAGHPMNGFGIHVQRPDGTSLNYVMNFLNQNPERVFVIDVEDREGRHHFFIRDGKGVTPLFQ